MRECVVGALAKGSAENYNLPVLNVRVCSCRSQLGHLYIDLLATSPGCQHVLRDRVH